MGGIALTRDVTQAALAGLSEAEAARRLEAGEGNERQATAGRSYARIVLQATFLPINLVLFVVTGVLLAVGLPIDAGLTALPVFGNIVVSAGLEASAKYRLDRLRILSTKRPTVIRDGSERSVDPSRLVRGDLVVIARGDQIVLDGDLVDGQIEVDESLLTGESDPVVRHPGEALRSGAVCVSGRGVVRVTRVGTESYANQLTAQAQSVRTERTPLQRSVEQLIGVATALVVVVSVVVAVSSRFGAGESAASIAQAAAVLVALVPQGLAIMITVTYATAALRISRAGALVQRINSVESMSRVDTLVLDKTGTITAPRFELREHARIGIDEATFKRLIAVVSGQMPAGDRIGAALHRWTADSGNRSASALPDAPASPCPVSDVVPFSSARRWSGMILADTGEAIVLGAPEIVLPVSVDRDVKQTVEQWTNGGLRTLVLARGSAPALRDASGEPRVPSTVTPVAVLAFAEEIRPDAADTLAAIQRSGVALKVVSGDNPRTVAHIAGEAGLEGAGRGAVDGQELTGLGGEALGELVDRATVIGRVEPTLKARIVQALRSRGHYVGMTGDGVNDILALKTAQLGIAMESGSGATRAVADIVLLGDRFSVLPKAVTEGRKVIDAMIGSSSLLLTRTVYMLLIVLGAAIGGLAFPFTPRNNSLLALITVGLPSLVVVAYPRPVQSPPDFLRTVLRFAVPTGIAVAAVALPVYAYYVAETGSVSVARSALVTVTTFCGTLLIPILADSNRQNAPSGRSGALDWRPTALALALVVLFGALMALPIARWFYEIEPIPPADAVVLGLTSIAWALVVFAARRLVVRASGPAESRELSRSDPTAAEGSHGR